MCPMVFPSVTNLGGLLGAWWFFDKLQDMDFHVFGTRVRWLIEVSADTFVWIVQFNVSKVVYEPVFES